MIRIAKAISPISRSSGVRLVGRARRPLRDHADRAEGSAAPSARSPASGARRRRSRNRCRCRCRCRALSYPGFAGIRPRSTDFVGGTGLSSGGRNEGGSWPKLRFALSPSELVARPLPAPAAARQRRLRARSGCARRAHRPRRRAEDRPREGRPAPGPSARRGGRATPPPALPARLRARPRLAHVYIAYEYVPGRRCARRCAPASSTTRPRSRPPRRCSRGSRTRTRTGSSTAT